MKSTQMKEGRSYHITHTKNSDIPTVADVQVRCVDREWVAVCLLSDFGIWDTIAHYHFTSIKEI